MSHNPSHERTILNLYMPYTSRDEITTAVEACVRDFMENSPNERYAIALFFSRIRKTHHFILTASPITEKDIDDHLMTSLRGSPPLDILIRTSGVHRLSDFFLWQVKVNLIAVRF